MSEQFEHAQEHLEHAAHEHGGSTSHTRAAIIIGIMAAVLAITEFAAKDAQTEYLTNHIAASDTWAQYQAKSVRRTILTAQADLLEGLPATDPLAKKRIADARADAERMHSEPGADGMEQLSEKAHDQERERDQAMHRNHILEIASGGLQIAIVLASISVVINLPAFMLVSVIVGGASVIYALLGGFSLLH
jgi:Domain of unknown function (DUF4337)